MRYNDLLKMVSIVAVGGLRVEGKQQLDSCMEKCHSKSFMPEMSWRRYEPSAALEGTFNDAPRLLNHPHNDTKGTGAPRRYDIRQWILPSIPPLS